MMGWQGLLRYEVFAQRAAQLGCLPHILPCFTNLPGQNAAGRFYLLLFCAPCGPSSRQWCFRNDATPQFEARIMVGKVDGNSGSFLLGVASQILYVERS